MLSLWNQFSVAMMAGSTVCDGSFLLKMVQCEAGAIHTVTHYIVMCTNWVCVGVGIDMVLCKGYAFQMFLSGCAAQT